MAYGNSYGGGYGDINWGTPQASQRDLEEAAVRRYWGSPDGQREQFEQGLIRGEQQRRQYDSETARSLGEQKYGVLNGLIGKMRSQFGGLR